MEKRENLEYLLFEGGNNPSHPFPSTEFFVPNHSHSPRVLPLLLLLPLMPHSSLASLELWKCGCLRRFSFSVTLSPGQRAPGSSVGFLPLPPSQWGTFSRRGTGEGERRHENYVPEKPVTHTNITQSEGKGRRRTWQDINY